MGPNFQMLHLNSQPRWPKNMVPHSLCFTSLKEVQEPLCLSFQAWRSGIIIPLAFLERRLKVNTTRGSSDNDLNSYLNGLFLSKRIVTPRVSSNSILQTSSMFMGILETPILPQLGHVSVMPLLLKQISDQWQASHSSSITSGRLSPVILLCTVFISSVGSILDSGESATSYFLLVIVGPIFR
jgi:hypothetical protein